jgi:gliding motility-associated-like protein
MPSSPGFNFGATTDFTIEFYIKTNSALPQAIVAKGDPFMPGFVVGLAAGVIVATASDGTNIVPISGFTNLADGTWHHVAVVFDRSDKITIYTDGFFDNDGSISSVGDVNNVDLLRVGAANVGGLPSQHFNGYIDEVRIWNKALTVAEINAARTVHLNTNSVTSNLVGYWDMNDLPGGVLVDCSPSGANGVLSGSASFSADAPTMTWNFNPVWSNGKSGNTIFENPLDTTTYKVQIGYCKYLSADSTTVFVIECEDVDETGLISSVWAANAFTPNGDFKNDFFLVQASNITYYEIMIFNRLGNIIYHSRNILNSWDGTFEGDRVEDAVYTYVITYRDRFDVQYKKYGTVTVLH